MNKFTFFPSFLEAAQWLPQDQKAAFVLAICEYGVTGQIPECDGVIMAMFTMAKPVIDKNRQLQENAKRKKPEANDEQIDSKCEANDEQTESKPEANDEQPVSKPIHRNRNRNKDKEKDLGEEKETLKERELEQEFEEVWKHYPRRDGKESAKKAYIRDRKKGATSTDILLGVNRYKAYLKRTETEDKYIKMGSTFFNQSCWQDEWRPPRGSVDHMIDDTDEWARRMQDDNSAGLPTDSQSFADYLA